MNLSVIFPVMLVVLAGSCVQSALGFGATMVTMGFLPLIMDYSKALGFSIALVTISTAYVSFRYRKLIRWKTMLPFLIPTAAICGIVNILSAKASSDVMYLLLGFMFTAVSIFFFVFSNKIQIHPTMVSGAVLGLICGFFYGLFGSGGPTAALYLLPATKDKTEYLATIQAFLFVNNTLILIISLVLGRLDISDIPMVSAGLIALLAGTLLGLKIHDRIPSESFGRVIYFFIGIGGIWIIVSHLL